MSNTSIRTFNFLHIYYRWILRIHLPLINCIHVPTSQYTLSFQFFIFLISALNFPRTSLKEVLRSNTGCAEIATCIHKHKTQCSDFQMARYKRNHVQYMHINEIPFAELKCSSKRTRLQKRSNNTARRIVERLRNGFNVRYFPY